MRLPNLLASLAVATTLAAPAAATEIRVGVEQPAADCGL